MLLTTEMPLVLPQPCVDDTTALPYNMDGRRRTVTSLFRVTSVETENPLERIEGRSL
jgi:hypothetical protein